MDAGIGTDNPWRTMANKRMISKEIIDSDAFLSMPISAQNLYFHLLMRADDDGFIDCVKKIMRFVGAGDDDLKILLVKRYLLAFDSGIIVIKHWRLHNTIQRDRYHATKYQEEMTRLFVKENGAYTDHKIDEIKSLPEIELAPTPEPVNRTDTECIQPANKMETEIRLDKIRLDKIRDPAKAGLCSDPLYTAVWNAFISRQPDKKFSDYGKEGSACKQVCKKIRARASPGEEMELAEKIVSCYYEYVMGSDRFWSSQPFTPMGLNTGNRFDSVIKRVYEEGADGG